MISPQRSYALVFIVLVFHINPSQTRHHGIRHKRQHGAHLYLPESFIVPGGESGDNWGEWGSPSECSRTCGGGVSYQTRECHDVDSEGAPRCTGGDKKYFSCNTQDCPEESTDFRQEQCTHFNDVPFEGVRYSWVPYTRAPNPCELNCMPRGERFYYRHKSKVIDGTRCNDESLDVCVDGKCQSVGCDMMLGSTAKEDKCRNCAGDGATCKTVSGVLDMNNLQVGYNDILLIPAGATNIQIKEKEPSNNYLAIRNLTGNYHLNGNWRIDFPRAMTFAGSIWHYDRKPQGFSAPDHLSSLGPTNEPVYLVLLYQDRNVGINYEYSVPEGSAKQSEPETYSWTFTNYKECSAKCGGGFQTRDVYCNSRSTLEQVDDSLCDAADKPGDTQQCGQESCPPRWVEGQWEKCSTPCGEEGSQNREIYCERVEKNGNATKVEDAVCLEQVGNKPATKQTCNADVVCPEWFVGPFSPCNKLCGDGEKKRQVVCYRKNEGKIVILADTDCITPKPNATESCILRPCEGVDYITSSWSGCKSCGQTKETRTAFCASKSGKIYNESFCANREAPELVRSCKSEACKFQWFTSQWSKCSADCGKGVQTRNVVCGHFDGELVRRADDEASCEADLKPKDSKDCDGGDECPGQWFTGPWSVCTKNCGGGEMTRKILCIAKEELVPVTQCDQETIEFATTACNVQECDEDQVIPLDPKVSLESDSKNDEDEEEEEDGWCDGDEGSGSGDDDDGVIKASSETDVYEYGSSSTTESTLETDELMQSDSTAVDLETTYSDSSTDIITTSEGSGEGSGDDSSTLFTESDDEKSTDTSSSDLTGSTDSSASTESSASTDSSKVTDDSSTEFPGTSDGSSDSTDSATESDSSDLTTASSSSTELSSDASETTTSGSSDATTDGATSSVDASTTEITETTTDQSSETSTDTTESSPTTEISTEESSIASTTDSDETTTDSVSTTVSDESSTSTESSTDSDSTTDSSSTSDSGISTESATETSIGSSTVSEDGSSTDRSSTDSSSTDSSTLSESEGTTVTSETELTDSTTTDITTESGSSMSPGSSESTDDGSSTTDDSSTESSGSTDSTITGETEVTESTVTGIEETTIDVWSVTESTTDDESSTSFTFESVVTKGAPKKCKRKPKKPACLKAQFGCCADNSTKATGPFDEGCPVPETCKETKHGCCPDGVSPAKGKNNEECPESLCSQSLFGCCPDEFTFAENQEQEGCPEIPTTVGGCAASKHGCCPDGISEATGPKNKGCEKAEVTAPVSPSDDVTEEPSETEAPKPKDCSFSEFGCCPDGLSESTGENFHGCDIIKDDCKDSFFGCCDDNKTSARGANKEGCGPCAGEPFGCCPDGNTPAHGARFEGCCLETEFGCCPDNITPARGTQLEGCSCESSPHGCCPDNTTSATGYYNEGCGCQHSPHGCCPDQSTPAQGANYTGCACHTFQFGCCPDGVSIPSGPHNYGCHCSQKEFKCCSDGVTPAQGPDFAGCTCATSKHGCCPDGVTESQGKDFVGCENVPESPQKACALAKEVGTCNNYTVKSFFDMDYGSCSKFWYGGCGGNKNMFDTIDDCKNICQEPEGKDTCNLPKVQGPCTGYYPMWHYDADRGHCTQFIYGGCLGNNNRFETKEECQTRCAVDESLEPCEQPADQGPCNGSFERWNFDHESDTCRPFTFGGCKPNKNNFATEHTCNYNCKKPGVMRASCSLPKETGDCTGKHARWSFDKTENKCMPFYFTGCKGNDNSFVSFEECETNCPKKIEKELCHLPAEIGECQDYSPRWYFDTKETRCRQFYYGGCGGNGNNFLEEKDCLQRCEVKPTTEAPAPAATPAPAFEKSQCLLAPVAGTCENYESRYYYNKDEGVCEQFGGCAGSHNNFPTYEECEQSCQDVQDTCTLRPVYGRCSENTTRWYYDNRADSCAEFEFSGCRGNTNNFYTQQDCENRCKQPVEIDQRVHVQDICSERLDHGSQECVDRVLSYFYNTETTECEAFEYTGCGGNGNRFESSEQCQRQCGGFKGVDVCSQPKETGPCDQWETRFYYNTQTRKCDAFTYGGCEGTGNRFNSLVECESVCISHEEPRPLDNKAICALPAQTGHCDLAQTYHKRWFYDDLRGTCISFIYSGCAGNQNNFRSFDSCEQFCKTSDESENLIDHTDSPNVCQSAFDECDALHCPYGVDRRYDENQCERCTCADPCQYFECPTDSNCAIDFQLDAFVPVCRQVNKPGECPQLGNNTLCDRECYTDSDCREESKCCASGCGFVCVAPADNATRTTEAPKPYYPGAKAPALEELPQEEVDVIAEEGGLATLRCFATGYPPPTISWKHGGIVVNTNQGRYVLTSTGDLQIVQLHRTDSGTYVCIADNGVGSEVTREVVLDVTDPKDTKTNAYIVGDSNSTLIATLNQPATIRCLAGGNPRPYISWWKGHVIMGLKTPNSEVTKDNSLVFHKVQLSDLGVYTCQAYSGEGKPAQITVTLKAVGPVHINNEADREYLKYLVDAPEIPKDKPTYPYRPAQTPPKIIPPPVVEQPQIIPVSAHLYSPTGSTTFAVGAEISLQCDVEGTPTPEVRWFKDDVQLEHSGRVQITAQRLSVVQATVEDAGHYKCEARNEYNVVGPTEYVSVEGVFVPPDCTDNPFFANCKLIVTGKYCTHKYYANFCCRSCTLAGQLGSFQSNLIN